MKKGMEEGWCIPVKEHARMPGVPAVVWTVEGFSGDAQCRVWGRYLSLSRLCTPSWGLFLGLSAGAVFLGH